MNLLPLPAFLIQLVFEVAFSKYFVIEIFFFVNSQTTRYWIDAPLRDLMSNNEIKTTCCKLQLQ